MKQCPNCGKQCLDQAAQCPKCKTPLTQGVEMPHQPISTEPQVSQMSQQPYQMPNMAQQPQQNHQMPNTPQQYPVKKKKGAGCLIVTVVVVLLLFFGIGFGIIQLVKGTEENRIARSQVEVVLDAPSFYISDTETISEEKLIEMLGEPDSIDEWNHSTPLTSYPIKTLYYGNYAYHFNVNMLQRISIDEEIPCENKNSILAMFGLKQYKNSKVDDTNFAYRVSNCGVYDFWVQYDSSKKTISSIKISYGSLFSE